MVPNAPYFGAIFDVADIKNKVFEYLAAYLKLVHLLLCSGGQGFAES